MITKDDRDPAAAAGSVIVLSVESVKLQTCAAASLPRHPRTRHIHETVSIVLFTVSISVGNSCGTFSGLTSLLSVETRLIKQQF